MAENNEDFNDMCVRLVETVKDGTTGDLIRNVDIIHEVAEYCRNTKIYTQNKDKADAFFKDMDASEAYKLMLIKVIQAPIMLMAHGSVILYMPAISDKLDNEIREKNIKDIKSGSYKGIFYGVEGSRGRKHYQPLLDYYLAKEQKKHV